MEGLKESYYKHVDQRTHVYTVTDMYIGSDEKLSREEWIFNINTMKMEEKTVDFVPGCERIYLEI